MDITRTMQLVERAQAGDEDSLNRLLERYFHRVRTIVRARMGTRLRRWNDSGDVIQQTFVAAVRRLKNFEMRNDAALINWLSKIAENQIRDLADAMQATKRDVDVEVSIEDLGGASADGDRAFDIESEGAGPMEVVSESEEQTLLDRAMARMTEEYRELILLRDYMGCSWAEVADETQRPTADAARMKYATARAQLTVLVNEERKTRSDTMT